MTRLGIPHVRIAQRLNIHRETISKYTQKNQELSTKSTGILKVVKWNNSGLSPICPQVLKQLIEVVLRTMLYEFILHPGYLPLTIRLDLTKL